MAEPRVNLSQEELRDLTLRAKEGDKAAEERAILALMWLVVKVAKQIARSKRLLTHIDELIGEGKLAVVKYLPRYNGQGKVTTYLLSCIRGAIHTAARQFATGSGAHVTRDAERNPANPVFRATFSLSQPFESDGDLGPQVAGHDEPIEMQMLRRERLELLHRVLGRLEPAVREVLLRRWGIGYARRQSFKEIGDALGISDEAARKHLLQAMRRLGIHVAPPPVYPEIRVRQAKIIEMPGPPGVEASAA